MATSIQSKTFSLSPARARVAGSVCALALAATGLVGIGINANAGSSHSRAAVPPQLAPAASAPVAGPLTYAYLVDSQVDADPLLAAAASDQNMRIVAADSAEGGAVINSMAASWASDANDRVIDLRR